MMGRMYITEAGACLSIAAVDASMEASTGSDIVAAGFELTSMLIRLITC